MSYQYRICFENTGKRPSKLTTRKILQCQQVPAISRCIARGFVGTNRHINRLLSLTTADDNPDKHISVPSLRKITTRVR